MKAAEPTTETSTSRSPAGVEPVPPPPATMPTPATPMSGPIHAAAPRAPPPAAMNSVTSTGVAPTISAAWLTLVWPRPAFWSRITAP